MSCVRQAVAVIRIGVGAIADGGTIGGRLCPNYGSVSLLVDLSVNNIHLSVFGYGPRSSGHPGLFVSPLLH